MLFLRLDEVLALHVRLIDEFGGSHGLRDQGLLESALRAPEQRHHYEGVGVAECAATYAFHLTKAHAFVDGNKRVGAASSELFLRLNGRRLNCTNDEVVDLFLRIAAGELSREEVEAFFVERTELP